ncbi:acyl-CoA dehydrogenase family protein (plasmid) [Rhodococcus pseudokoreensis]|uniref:Acyl-CoA dehydrogenase family protein n=1 Tax=Rhodococcus pseudokoreensis TaxID=2811421 RepID=A0A974VYS5_9NOCA|nr:acyl-CoA dehydrogenase family protein [Rhodococcus pseudokoreensis]QSE88019.1 acyl-CoA dehydrogenase family protein [Rhodococcus pseudokoreensis]
MNYTPPIREMQFVLHEVLDAAGTLQGGGIDIDRDTIDGVIEGAGDFCARVLDPINAVGDREGCRLVGDTVVTPPGFKKAYDQYVVGGWPAVDCEVEHGGGGMPSTVGSVIKEMLAASNPSWSLYTSLSAGTYWCLNVNASDALKRRYLPQLASGKWTGTMCLTEPHCGTDLGLLTTRAVPADDGSYLISGTKMFISSGEHDLAENIVHLVLARTPDAPKGTRGISLFAVSKHTVGSDGAVGDRNGVYCDSIESKMGLHGSSTCVLRFENAVGHLVGEVNMGLAAMFVMMNSARLGTGVQALGMNERANQKATAYARERIQSRAPESLRTPNQAADSIIDQPDVRRMLLTQKAWVGGSRLFLYWLALQVDLRKSSSDPAIREYAEDMLSLLTPVAKAFVSDRAVESASLGMQVHGGAGYIIDYGAEQILRDARILPIYEGTNGVQSHDLLQRKVLNDGGRRLKQLLEMVSNYAHTLEGREEMDLFRVALITLAGEIDTLTTDLARWAQDDDLRVGTSAVDFLNLVGYYVFAYFWARAADTVVQLGDQATDLHKQQLAVARYYFDKLLPDTLSLLVRARSDTAILMDDAAIAF